MQAPITCQLCEESREIKWKCLQCNFLMCSRCKKIHQKVKSSDQHKIIDIKDIAEFQQHSSDPDFNTIECGVHAGQIYCLFCQTCEEVVCPSCIAKTHNEHKMTVINEAYNLAMKSIKCINSEVKQKLSEIVTTKSKLGAIKSSENLKYAKEKKKVLARNNLLKDEVNKLTRKLLNELEQKHDELMKSVNHEENRSEKIRQDLELRNNNISKIVRSNNAIQVFRTYKEEKLAEEMNALQITTKFKKLPEFLPGNIQSLESLYGKLHEPEDKYTDIFSCFEFKVIQQYKTDMPIFEELICGNDGLMWISFTNGNVLQKICLSKGSTLNIQAYDVTPLSIALLPSGDLVISSMKSYLNILSQSTGAITESKYGVAPLQTVAVHVTKTNQIIVGAREKGPPFPVNGPRQVIVMNMQGKKKKRYHLDNKRNPIFSQPRSITTDSDNNIYVLDLLSIEMNQGRIVSLNNSSGVKWTYDGHQMANKELLFAPKDFVTTPLNNIIVVDNNHMIHILNRTGECIHFVHTTEFDIHWPRSIDIDKSGTLYIGCKINNKWDPWEAKVHVVQFSGF
ncbi:uncharacterized protein LOC143068382 [Mytilus galloprovincialis]|uniref:uncharacterized protein LOC143068382 n=1 Tax=Mytilus galloprovincialis TaxID=29158 RepID=UPI003F7BE4B1